MVRPGSAFLGLLLSTFFLGFLFLARPGLAYADQPGAHTVPVAVLAFDSEDVEEQADAITTALRSRIRAAQGWSLVETTQSLGMLTAAMKCSPRPLPVECQQRIAEQIKAERYIWGFVSKGPTLGQVTSEVHLFQRNKPDTVVRESYTDNLKDPNDDALRKIAMRVVERLAGTAVGVVLVRATESSGDVIIDGQKRVPLEKGFARVELAPGSHSVEVTFASGPPSKRNVIVAAGRETAVELVPVKVSEPEASGGKANTRKVIGGVAMGVGAVLGGVAVYSLVNYFDFQSQGAEAATRAEKTDPPTPCRLRSQECARIDKSSKTASALAIGFGSGAALALGFGVYMFFSEPSKAPAVSTPPRAKTRVVPMASGDAGGFLVVGSF